MSNIINFLLGKLKSRSTLSVEGVNFYPAYYVAQWTEQQINLGKPATLTDFFVYHGVCPECEGAGQWIFTNNVVKTCDTCQGSGRTTNQ